MIVRGNNRQETFCAEDDYLFYLEKLQAACVKQGCVVHAYVLMTNHVHLLVTPQSGDNLPLAMQMLGRYYVQYYNCRHRRTGTLWEGRYKATLIDSVAYLLTCMRYIELNPVRAAGMVSHPSEYRWSSYMANAHGADDPLVIPHHEYRTLGRSAPERQSAYRQLFKSHLGEDTLSEIRTATNKAWVLGSDRFKHRVQRQLERRLEPAPRGGDRKSARYKKASAKINRV